MTILNLHSVTLTEVQKYGSSTNFCFVLMVSIFVDRFLTERPTAIIEQHKPVLSHPTTKKPVISSAPSNLAPPIVSVVPVHTTDASIFHAEGNINFSFFFRTLFTVSKPPRNMHLWEKT